MQAYSQTSNISITASSFSLKDILLNIEKQTNYFFVYDKSEIDLEQKLSINVQNERIEDVLSLLLTGTNIAFAIEGRNIMLMKWVIDDFGFPVILQPRSRRRITGTVTDSKGEAIIGANVVEKGVGNGTVTDARGNFNLKVSPEATLVISYIGCYVRELPLEENAQHIKVTLIEDNRMLDEVVVIGYGIRKKVNLTGAVSTTSGEVLTKRPIVNASAMMEGIMSGVEVVSATGEPGNDGTTVTIRGTGTFSSAGSSPLVLIDGVIGNMSDLNPNDIESVSVLKDAASASIYGARAANGVILITTKTGTEGKLRINYSGNFAVHTYTKMLELISNSAEYMELWNEAKLNSEIDVGLYTPEMINTYRYAKDRVKYPNTNWLDLMFDPAPTQTHNLSFNGGSSSTKYNVSLGYVDQRGVMKGFDYKRYNFRLNLTSRINKAIKFGTIVGITYGDKIGARQGSQDQFIATMAQAPTYGPYLPDGSGRYAFKAYDFESNNKNPMVIYKEKVTANLKNYIIASQGWLEVTPFKNFTWYTKVAVNMNFDITKNFRPQVPLYNFHTYEYMTLCDVGGSGLTETDTQNVYTNLFSYLNYENTDHDYHSFKAQIGYNVEQNKNHFLTGARRNFPDDELREINAGGQDIMINSGNTIEWAIISYFGRIGYSFKDRYLLEASLRNDGSSRLPRSGRWGVFPSISGAWRVSEEMFVKNMHWSWFNNLKIHGNYGILGNQNIGDYPYQAMLTYTGNYPFDNSTLTTGIAQTALNNMNITWESTSILCAGLDLMVFDGLSLTFDWYNKRTWDILTSTQLTGIVGLTAPIVNKGVLENRGYEIGLSYRKDVLSGRFKGLSYYGELNFSHNVNKLLEYGTEEKLIQNDISVICKEGVEWNAFYLLEWDGIFQSEKEITDSPKQFSDKTLTGDLKWKDQNTLDTNGDGIPDAPDGVINADDRVVMKGQYPAFQYSYNVGISWKGFDFYLFFNGVQGKKFYVADWGTVPFSQGAPPTTDWRKRWTPTHPSETMPRIYWGRPPTDRINRPSSFFLKDGSYLRMKSASIGYTVPSQITHAFGVDLLKFYVAGDNLFTFTKFSGLDPERIGLNNRFVSYPQNKIFSIGVNLNF
ncbi:SusC/RagA family TonB-linked outer membrane protein [Bacteroidia bacterium]|nr:SusC/RagA family TonB-linked outer membrane protein [Bacteroidia bacterium]